MEKKRSSKNRRRIYIVDGKYQIRYLFYHDILEVLALIAGVFILYFLLFVRITQERVFHSAWSADLVHNLYLLLFLVGLLVIYRSLIRSHQIAGPFVRMSRIMDRMKRGDLSQDLLLRDKDRIQSLAQDFRDMQEGLRQRIRQDRAAGEKAIEALEQLRDELRTAELSDSDRRNVDRRMSAIEERLKGLGKAFVLTPDEHASAGEEKAL